MRFEGEGEGEMSTTLHMRGPSLCLLERRQYANAGQGVDAVGQLGGITEASWEWDSCSL